MFVAKTATCSFSYIYLEEIAEKIIMYSKIVIYKELYK